MSYNTHTKVFFCSISMLRANTIMFVIILLPKMYTSVYIHNDTSCQAFMSVATVFRPVQGEDFIVRMVLKC